MNMRLLLYGLIASGYTLTLILAVLLVRTYRRTHDIGFIWLGVAVLVWPLAARLLWAGLGYFVVDAGGVGPFQSRAVMQPLFTMSQQVCGLVLLLVAVLRLGKARMAGNASN
jgi:hypothetical protein